MAERVKERERLGFRFWQREREREREGNIERGGEVCGQVIPEVSLRRLVI